MGVFFSLHFQVFFNNKICFVGVDGCFYIAADFFKKFALFRLKASYFESLQLSLSKSRLNFVSFSYFDIPDLILLKKYILLFCQIQAIYRHRLVFQTKHSLIHKLYIIFYIFIRNCLIDILGKFSGLKIKARW